MKLDETRGSEHLSPNVGCSSVCLVSSSAGRSKMVPAAVQISTPAKHKATIRTW
jgi:hypothetical protein